MKKFLILLLLQIFINQIFYSQSGNFSTKRGKNHEWQIVSEEDYCFKFNWGFNDGDAFIIDCDSLYESNLQNWTVTVYKEPCEGRCYNKIRVFFDGLQLKPKTANPDSDGSLYLYDLKQQLINFTKNIHKKISIRIIVELEKFCFNKLQRTRRFSKIINIVPAGEEYSVYENLGPGSPPEYLPCELNGFDSKTKENLYNIMVCCGEKKTVFMDAKYFSEEYNDSLTSITLTADFKIKKIIEGNFSEKFSLPIDYYRNYYQPVRLITHEEFTLKSQKDNCQYLTIVTDFDKIKEKIYIAKCKPDLSHKPVKIRYFYKPVSFYLASCPLGLIKPCGKNTDSNKSKK